MNIQASPMQSADTFARSCDHWSEEGRSGMEQFYVLATEDYRQLALSHDWAAWLQKYEERAGNRLVRLLDVACGSGKFPIALQAHANLGASALKTIRTDLLDPTQFSLDEAARVLERPFELADSHLSPTCHDPWLSKMRHSFSSSKLSCFRKGIVSFQCAREASALDFGVPYQFVIDSSGLGQRLAISKKRAAVIVATNGRKATTCSCLPYKHRESENMKRAESW